MSFGSVMQEIGKDVVLALNVSGQLSPLVSGAIQVITAVTNKETGEVEYTVVIKSGKQELDTAGQQFRDTLAKINVERNVAGLPALDIPDFDAVVDNSAPSPDQPPPTPQEASSAAGTKLQDADVQREGLDRG
jgi:hypothetical protein